MYHQAENAMPRLPKMNSSEEEKTNVEIHRWEALPRNIPGTIAVCGDITKLVKKLDEAAIQNSQERYPYSPNLIKNIVTKLPKMYSNAGLLWWKLSIQKSLQIVLLPIANGCAIQRTLHAIDKASYWKINVWVFTKTSIIPTYIFESAQVRLSIKVKNSRQSLRLLHAFEKISTYVGTNEIYSYW